MLARETPLTAKPRRADHAPNRQVPAVLEFGGRLLLAALGGLVLIAIVLALMVTAYVSSLGHRQVQRATAPLPAGGFFIPPGVAP